MLTLTLTNKRDPVIRTDAANHYSHPKGFVARSLCYLVGWSDGSRAPACFGSIIAGSATRHLPGRWEFFGEEIPLNNLVNNVFFHVEPPKGDRYPCRNFTTKVLSLWRARACEDWWNKYGDEVTGFESLVELPRTGECYLRDGWLRTGITQGYQCKREAGKGTDSWSGRRVWRTAPEDLRPKLVLCREA